MAAFRYIGKETADPRFHDGGLRPVIGAHNIQAMRANRAHPEESDGLGHTYNHAPMLCRWHGKLRIMYLTSPVHEHGGFARVMETESEDGCEWSFPRVLFPEIPVPAGVYQGPGAERLPANAKTVAHHRMGFYRAPNDVLVASTFYGVSPDPHIAPNNGWGMGRVVRRIIDDGGLGEIYVLRVNRPAGWEACHFPWRLYTACEDPTFVDACEALLKDWLATAAWWEEERLDENFFPLKGIKAPSFCPLPDGKTAVIGKMGWMAVSEDRGKNWSKPEQMEGIYTASGKCAMMATGDGKRAIVYHPSPDGQHRWPLAIVTSENGYAYDQPGCVCGEVPPMRYGGLMKSWGPQYVRAIMPGNDDAPDGATWLAYSMNKEDLWAVRLPATIETWERQPVRDQFDERDGPLPERWYTYSPQWSPIRVEGRALTLRTGDPCDYGKAVRAFPEGEQARAELWLVAEKPENGELQIEVEDGRGMAALKLILGRDGMIRLRGGNGEVAVCGFHSGEELCIRLWADCRGQRVQAAVNGSETAAQPLMYPCRSVERITLRTGGRRLGPTVEDNLKNVCLPDLKNADVREKEAIYRLISLDVYKEESP